VSGPTVGKCLRFSGGSTLRDFSGSGCIRKKRLVNVLFIGLSGNKWALQNVQNVEFHRKVHFC